MKPVKNRTKSCLTIGKIYKYIGEDDGDESDGEFEVLSFRMCQRREGCYVKDKCDGMTYNGDDDNEWCGVYRDFEEVGWA